MSEKGSHVGPLTNDDVDALLSLAYLLTGDRSQSQDLVQSVLVHLLETGRRDVDQPRAYAKRAVVNRFISDRRRASLAHRKLRLVGVPDEPVPSHDQRIVEREVVRAALGRLRPKERAAVVLRYWDDLDDKRIAELLGCREATVRSLLSRARTSMRVELEEEKN